MFSFLERNPFFFTVAFLLVFSIAGLVEVLPGFAKKAQPIEGLKPYSLLETERLQEDKYILQRVVIIAIHSLFVHLRLKQTDMVLIA